jgi:general secretion pathway protein N
MEQLHLRLFADGRYRAELRVRSPDPAVQQRLAAAGFAANAGFLVKVIDGAF